MFSAIKGYLNIIIGAVVVAFLAYVKYLMYANKDKKQTIADLKQEIKAKQEANKQTIKQEAFKAVQKDRADSIKENEVRLDDIEKKIKPKKADDNFVDVGV